MYSNVMNGEILFSISVFDVMVELHEHTIDDAVLASAFSESHGKISCYSKTNIAYPKRQHDVEVKTSNADVPISNIMS